MSMGGGKEIFVEGVLKWEQGRKDDCGRVGGGERFECKEAVVG
jgi:hypothetical protein